MSFEIFDAKNQLLPVACKPYPDEILTSWLTRLAYKHGLSTRAFIGLVLPGKILSMDIDRHIADEDMQTLAERAGCTFEEVKNTTLWSYEHSLFGKMERKIIRERWLLPGRRPGSRASKKHYSSGILYCPSCLQKGKIYFKKNWRLAISFACIDCGCYLVEACPNCKRGNSFIDDMNVNCTAQSLNDYMVTCHACQHNVMDCKIVQAPHSSLQLQKALYRILENGVDERIIYTESYFKVLHDMASLLYYYKFSKSNLGSLSRSVVPKYIDPPDKEIINPEVKHLPLKSREIYVAEAFKLLQNWPYNFLELCLKYHVRSADVLAEFTDEPYWFREAIVTGLNLTYAREKVNNQNVPDEVCSVRLKEYKLQRLDYDYDFDDYFYDDNKYEDDPLDVGDYDQLGKITALYGYSPFRMLRTLMQVS